MKVWTLPCLVVLIYLAFPCFLEYFRLYTFLKALSLLFLQGGGGFKCRRMYIRMFIIGINTGGGGGGVF